MFKEHPPIALTSECNGFEKRAGQGIAGLYGFKSAVERPLKECRINALAACSRELRQTIVLFLTLLKRRAALYM
ncbi:hypothetical protein C4K40_1718 [Pseudomonas sp. CMR5c]|nr:hypothetical protein C4K40_1718 [Pseudomonas sp. CMR5c]